MNRKFILSLMGALLIITGIALLIYQKFSAFSVSGQEKVTLLGPIALSATVEKSVHFSPVIGGLFLIIGLVLIIAGRIK